MSQFPSQGEKENPLKTAPIKDTVADSDGVVLVDGQDVGTKRVLWSTIKSALGQIFAPLTRKINNKPLSSDVVLTGDDIATSATDGTTVSSSLSNKVDENVVSVTSTDDLINLLGTKKVGFFTDWAGVTPVRYSAGSLVKGADVRKTVFWGIGVNDISPYFGCIDNTDNTVTFKKGVTATPPQEYDLPLADGITGYAKYSKDQFGQVLITLQEIQKSDGSKLGNINIETLGALPVGYRPCRGINTAAVATNIEGVPIHGIYQLWIDESGAVKCYGQYGVEATMLRGILIFQAQN